MKFVQCVHSQHRSTGIIHQISLLNLTWSLHIVYKTLMFEVVWTCWNKFFSPFLREILYFQRWKKTISMSRCRMCFSILKVMSELLTCVLNFISRIMIFISIFLENKNFNGMTMLFTSMNLDAPYLK
jgi:hypothetical protein